MTQKAKSLLVQNDNNNIFSCVFVGPPKISNTFSSHIHIVFQWNQLASQSNFTLLRESKQDYMNMMYILFILWLSIEKSC